MVAMSNATSNVMDRLGRWRPIKRRQVRGLGGIPSRDSGYFAITSFSSRYRRLFFIVLFIVRCSTIFPSSIRILRAGKLSSSR